MTREEQDKLWNNLSEEKKKEYRKEFQKESESHSVNVVLCDTEDEFEYRTGYSNGVITTLEELFGEHNLKPDPLTYEDVARELFGTGIDEKCQFATVPYMGMRWANKIQALGRLLVVAKFLNKNEDGSDWVPDWKSSSGDKWYIFIDGDGDVHVDEELDGLNSRIVYFRTEELARQAVQILGKDVIRTALTTEY